MISLFLVKPVYPKDSRQSSCVVKLLSYIYTYWHPCRRLVGSHLVMPLCTYWHPCRRLVGTHLVMPLCTYWHPCRRLVGSHLSDWLWLINLYLSVFTWLTMTSKILSDWPWLICFCLTCHDLSLVVLSNWSWPLFFILGLTISHLPISASLAMSSSYFCFTMSSTYFCFTNYVIYLFLLH